MRARLLAAVAMVMLVAADKPKGTDDAKKEAEKLLGTWKLVAIESNGKREKADDATMVATKDKLTLRVGTHTGEALYAVDASQKPRHFDVAYTGKSCPERKGTAKGIFELDGDMLTICGNAIGSEPRPRELKTQVKAGLTLEVYERVKR